ncbi:hypothetical protein GTO36_01710, partial [bacterium]|nr:hypothetical protein [bacterium]
MRKILTIFIVLILVVGIVSVAKSTNYDIDTDVSGSWPSTYTSNVRHVVQSSDGTIVVFYFSAKSGGGLVVRKSTSSGVTDSWTDLAGGAGYTVIDSNYSSIRGYSIDIDDNDNIYVAYDDDNDIKFMKLEASPGTWTTWSLGTERTVDAANNNAYPSITRQSNGRVWVSYGQDNGTSAWLRA